MKPSDPHNDTPMADALHAEWRAASPSTVALPPEEMASTLKVAMGRWSGATPLWVFGYGSLIWKPELTFDRRVPARIFGYHRSLCLRSLRYRGTPAFPGLVAGLKRGGSCAGVALRLPASGLLEQFEKLWHREMSLGAYDARWLRARRLDNGAALHALAFVVRPQAPQYCGSLSQDKVLTVLRQAQGAFGTSLDYLESTVRALRAEGLQDPNLERLLHAARSDSNVRATATSGKDAAVANHISFGEPG